MSITSMLSTVEYLLEIYSRVNFLHLKNCCYRKLMQLEQHKGNKMRDELKTFIPQ